jgi:hypothetical protein
MIGADIIGGLVQAQVENGEPAPRGRARGRAIAYGNERNSAHFKFAKRDGN